MKAFNPCGYGRHRKTPLVPGSKSGLIRKVLAERGNASTAEIAEALGLTVKQISTLIASMQNGGTIVKLDGPDSVRATPVRWRLK